MIYKGEHMNSQYAIKVEYDKPHKFFDKYLDNDLKDLSNFLKNKSDEIENAKIRGVSKLNEKNKELFVESGSISTVKWREYNVFQFYHEGIYNLFSSLSEVVKEACDYYEIDFKQQQYMVQGWFNINYHNKGKLDWHDHGAYKAPIFHGYYCVNAEPSSTYYKIDNDDNRVVENINYNNRMIVSEMGHPHAMGDWNWEGERITVAYDILPLKHVKTFTWQEQHWIPLL